MIVITLLWDDAPASMMVTAPAPMTSQTGASHDERGVLVDADAEIVRVLRHRREQASDPSALREVLVDELARGDMTGPRSAHVVLGEAAVEVAVLETARGGIVRGGLGWDWADVGVITNVQADHIGQEGIRSLDDIVYIKSLVAERVREGGTLVLTRRTSGWQASRTWRRSP